MFLAALHVFFAFSFSVCPCFFPPSLESRPHIPLHVWALFFRNSPRWFLASLPSFSYFLFLHFGCVPSPRFFMAALHLFLAFSFSVCHCFFPPSLESRPDHAVACLGLFFAVPLDGFWHPSPFSHIFFFSTLVGAPSPFLRRIPFLRGVPRLLSVPLNRSHFLPK